MSSNKSRTRAANNQNHKNGGIIILSSDQDSSDSSSKYSDWLSESQSTIDCSFSPPKLRKRKTIDRKSNGKHKQKRKPSLNVNSINVTGIEYPSKWLREVTPWRIPYHPQVGDDVVYFQQGHQKYLDVLKHKFNYVDSSSSKPWTKINMKAQEYCKIIGIKYFNLPPQFCSLRLVMVDEEGHLTGDSFTVKYHYLADVQDFIILKQVFDVSLKKNFTINMEFRSVYRNAWRIGQIRSIEPLDQNFLTSHFMCCNVRWDNGDVDTLSPWDLDQVDNKNLPEVHGGRAPVLERDIRKSLYQPHQDEWPLGDRGLTCRRVIGYLDQVVQLPIAESFLAPVDLDVYPEYAQIVAYPVDLSLLRARLDSRFYRRITAVKFDLRYLAKNAETFNGEGAPIAKRARILVDLCLSIIKDIDKEIDVTTLYNKMSAPLCVSSDSEMEVVDIVERPSPQRPANNRLNDTPKRSSPRKRARSTRKLAKEEWSMACERIVRVLWNNEDFAVFREPVDSLDCPDYERIVTIPMCMRWVLNDLEERIYKDSKEFMTDMNSIFTNSRTYYQNSNSEIYKATTRFRTMLEELLEPVLARWSARNGHPKTNINKTKRVNNSINQAGPSKRNVIDNYDEHMEDKSSSSDYPDDETNDPTFVPESQTTVESEGYTQFTQTTLESEGYTQVTQSTVESEEYTQVLSKLSQCSTIEYSTSTVPADDLVDNHEHHLRMRNHEVLNNNGHDDSRSSEDFRNHETFTICHDESHSLVQTSTNCYGDEDSEDWDYAMATQIALDKPGLNWEKNWTQVLNKNPILDRNYYEK